MLDNQNFIWDDVNFANITMFIHNLHTKNMKFIPVLDGGDIVLRREYIDPKDAVYNLVATTSNILIRHGGIFEASPFIGQNLAVDCVYFDWFSVNAGKIWETLLQSYLNFWSAFTGPVTVDGYWFNMN